MIESQPRGAEIEGESDVEVPQRTSSVLPTSLEAFGHDGICRVLDTVRTLDGERILDNPVRSGLGLWVNSCEGPSATAGRCMT